MRTGIGYDIHRLAEGRKLVLGGVHIPYIKGLQGYSDADVLLHAICDALLGASGLGDIGLHFPDTDESFRNISSLELLKRVYDLLKGTYSINNIDATVIAQEPKIMPFIGKMKKNISQAIGVSEEILNIKSTTNEQIGALGRGEGIASIAIATIKCKK